MLCLARGGQPRGIGCPLEARLPRPPTFPWAAFRRAPSPAPKSKGKPSCGDALNHLGHKQGGLLVVQALTLGQRAPSPEIDGVTQCGDQRFSLAVAYIPALCQDAAPPLHLLRLCRKQ